MCDRLRKHPFVLAFLVVIFVAMMLTTILVATLPKLAREMFQDKGQLNKEFDWRSALPLPSPEATRLEVFQHASVVTDVEKCSEIGKDILIMNGSAVDAAIAAMLCVGVYYPHSAGIGGGSVIMIYKRANNRVEVTDATETVPSDIFSPSPDDENAKIQDYGNTSPKSIGVPGELKGFWDIHQKYGELPWSTLFKAVIELCQNGHHVPAHLARALIREDKFRDIIRKSELKDIFLNEASGKLVTENDTIYQHKLAETLQTIADKGVKAFYSGSVGEDLIKDIQQRGGILSKEDLAGYEPKIRKPLSTRLNLSKGRSTVWMYGAPPPASSVLMMHALQILNGFDPIEETGNLTADTNLSILFHHRVLEALKFAYGKRSMLSVEESRDFENDLKRLISPEYGDKIRNKISDDKTHNPDYYVTDDWQPSNWGKYGTSQVSVVAPNGDAVVITSSINRYFGSGVYSPSTGIILNNQLDNFNKPNHSNNTQYSVYNNVMEPGKRPMTSISPAIFVDSEGNTRLLLGGAGGIKIVSALTYVASRILFLNEDPETAVVARRPHHQLFPPVFFYEEGFPEEVVEGLVKLGHFSYKMPLVSGSVVSTILREKDGLLSAYPDFRRGGKATGY